MQLFLPLGINLIALKQQTLTHADTSPRCGYYPFHLGSTENGLDFSRCRESRALFWDWEIRNPVCQNRGGDRSPQWAKVIMGRKAAPVMRSRPQLF